MYKCTADLSDSTNAKKRRGGEVEKTLEGTPEEEKKKVGCGEKSERQKTISGFKTLLPSFSAMNTLSMIRPAYRTLDFISTILQVQILFLAY